MKRRKIATILCTSLVGIILVSSIIQSWIVTGVTRKSAAESYAMDCTQITNAYSLAIANKVSEYMNQMNFYISADVVESCDEEKIALWLAEHNGARKSYFNSVLFAGKSGIARTDNGDRYDVSNEKFYKEIMEKGKSDYVDTPAVDQKGDLVFHVAKAAKIHGELIGVFSAVVPIYNIQNMVKYVLLGETGQAWIFTDNGTVIANNNSSYMMKLNLLNQADSPELTQAIKKAVNGGIGSEWVTGLGSYRGRSFITYTPIANTPWFLAFSIAESQVYSTGNKLSPIFILISLITVIIIGISCLFITKILLRPVAAMEKSINEIASGNADLTQRIDIKSKTEIGSVVDGFNSFTEKLQNIVLQLKASKDHLSSAGDQMSSCSSDTAQANKQILDNIYTITTQINHQSDCVSQTAGAVDQIASNIQSLERMIETQVASVTQASAAVEEMIGNIDSVNSSVQQMANQFNQLEENSSMGADKQREMNVRINQIVEESKMLQEANKTIASIASQTNLLAMNAAIEAAHAGDAGKGFSVVADEIRKLSETSSAQSKTIGTQLQSIHDSISNVAVASEESNRTFMLVTDKIKQTTDLVSQISSAMEEQAEGSRQIGIALGNMNNSALEVRTASREIAEGNKSILAEIKELQDITDSINNSMTSITSTTDMLSVTGAALNEITSSVGSSISEIGMQVDQFRV